jgi:hypothetical protein
VHLFHVKLDRYFFPSFSKEKKMATKRKATYSSFRATHTYVPPTPDKASIWCIPSGKMRKKNPKTSYQWGKIISSTMEPPPTMLNKH